MTKRPGKSISVRWQRRICLCVFGLVVAAAPFSRFEQNAQAATELDQAKELLRQSEDEWRREDKAYRDAQQAGRLKPQEQADYAEFVAGLRVRLLEQCEVVRAIGGNSAVSDFECIRLGAPPRRIVLPDASAVQTEEEKKAAIVAKLSELEGKIDEALMKRQQEMKETAAAEAASNSASGGGGAGGASGGTSGNASSPGSVGQQASTSQAGQRSPSGSQSSSTSQSSGRSGSEGAAIPNTGSPANQTDSARGPSDKRRVTAQSRADGGVDDDVVARQLREAAERESDPVLKEKLWAEYRKYKGAKK